MRPKSMLLLALALGCGLVASIGISQVMDKRSKQTGPAAPETESIYVALTDINLGDTISAELLELQDWPKDKIQPGAIREIDDVVGRRPRTKIYQGDPILDAKLVSADAPDAPSEQIPSGYRTFAVKVNEEEGTAGLARAGDRVDIQLFVKKDERDEILETKVHTILYNVRVFAVDQVFRRGTEQEEGGSIAKTITLVVTPKEGSMLNLAAETGTIRLVLRNPDDEIADDDTEVTLADLLKGKSTADEDAERGLVEEETEEGEEGSGLAGFLQRMKAGNQPLNPADQLAVVTPPFIMAVLEGSSTREVTFTEEGRLPQQGSVANPMAPATSGATAAEPAADLDNEESQVDDEELGADLDELKKELNFND